MKTQKIFALMLIALGLCFTSCSSDDDSCTALTWYLDADGDNFGTPGATLSACTQPLGYAATDTDCDDSDASVFPGATDAPNDGVDSDCDGTVETIIWTGTPVVFAKAANADWTLPANQDALTRMVVFTRQDNRQIYNYQWWQDNGGVDATSNQLNEDFWDSSIATSVGGTRGVRWAILDDTGADNPWDTNFNMYGTLGDPTNYYSFHNIATMITELNDGDNIASVIDDFEVEIEGGGTRSGTQMTELIGKNLGVWLVDEDIYLTLTFTEWGSGGSGGALGYTRSSE